MRWRVSKGRSPSGGTWRSCSTTQPTRATSRSTTRIWCGRRKSLRDRLRREHASGCRRRFHLRAEVSADGARHAHALVGPGPPEGRVQAARATDRRDGDPAGKADLDQHEKALGGDRGVLVKGRRTSTSRSRPHRARRQLSAQGRAGAAPVGHDGRSGGQRILRKLNTGGWQVLDALTLPAIQEGAESRP